MGQNYGSGEEEVPPRPHRPQPERMGYTSGPGEPVKSLRGALDDAAARQPGDPHTQDFRSYRDGVNVGNMNTDHSALIAGFEIALIKSMAAEGIEFRRVQAGDNLPSYEHVIEACQNHINRTLATLRSAPRENWEAHEADSIRTLKGDFERLGIADALDWPR